MNQLRHYNPDRTFVEAWKDLPLSQAVAYGDLVFVAGQVADTTQRAPGESVPFKEEAREVFSKLVEVLRSAGSDQRSIIKLTVYLSDLADFDSMNEVLTEFIEPPYPARMTLGAVLRGFQLEVEAVAAVTRKQFPDDR